MRLSFRKSVRVGGLRINLSKSGIGMSSGIKGLRVGVNSKGKTYVSAGINGLHIRKTVSSNRSKKNNYNTEVRSERSDNRILYLGLFCTIFVFVGFVYPLLFVIPLAVVIAFLLSKYMQSQNEKKIDEYINKINEAVNVSDFIQINRLLDEINNRITDDKGLLEIYETTYMSVVKKAIDDKLISDNEKEVIGIFCSKLKKETMEEINEKIIDSVVENIIFDGTVTREEEEYLGKLEQILIVNQEKKNEIVSVLSQIKKIDDLRKCGLKKIQVNNSFLNDKEYYYEASVELLKYRKIKGEQYYEKDKNVNMYVSKTHVEFVNDGYKKIKNSDILNTEYKNGLVEITVLNRQKPIVIKANEPMFLIAIIGEMKKLLTIAST